MNNMFSNFLDKRHYRQDQLNEDFTYKKRDFIQVLANFCFNTIRAVKLISATDSKFVILLFLIGLVTIILFYPCSTQDYFINNLYPELFGFCLEGLLLTGFLTLLIERKENVKNEKIRLGLRKLLLPYLKHIDEKYTKPSSTYPVDLNNPETVYFFLKNWTFQFAQKSKVEQNLTISFFKNYSKEISPSLVAFIPVMAQLSPELLAVTLKLNRIVLQIKDGDIAIADFPPKVIDLIGIVGELDELNFVGNRLTKNLQQLMNLDIVR